MANQDNTQVLRGLYEAVSNRDFERALSFFQDNGEFKSIAFDQVFRGKSEIQEMMQSWVKAFPDMRLEALNIVGLGDWAAAEINVKGTHRGPFATPEGDISPTNQPIKAPSCDLVKFRDGKIVSVHCYLESGILMRQLGLKPAKAAA